jgi:hypothetical protein
MDPQSSSPESVSDFRNTKANACVVSGRVTSRSPCVQEINLRGSALTFAGRA